MVFFAIAVFALAFCLNLRALAMEPWGILRDGSGDYGLDCDLMAIPISTFIGRYILHSVYPVFLGFMVCGVLSAGLLRYSKMLRDERDRGFVLTTNV